MEKEAFHFRIVFVAACCMATMIFFWQLGTPPLENWDEGIHAEVTLETVQRHSWIDLSYRGEYYTAKPPLKFWLTAPLFILFGPSEFTTRFWSALAGVGTTLLLALWAWQWKRKAWPALLAALLFVTLRANFYHAFRTGETDGLMVFFIVLALWAYWKSWANGRYWWIVGTGIGLTFMTKPLGGLLPLAMIGLDITAGWRWKELPWKYIGFGALCATLLAVPWHIVESIRHGSAFWSNYVGFHVLERASEVLYKNFVPWWWYWTIMQVRAFPYVPFVVLSMILGLWRWVRGRDALDRLLVIWLVVVFMLFTFVQTKFDWYILPLYPAAVLLCVRAVAHLQEHTTFPLRLLLLATFGWTMYLLPSGLVKDGTLWKLTAYAYLPTISTTDWIQRTFVTTVSIVIVALIYLAFRRLFQQSALVMTGSLALLFLLLLGIGWQVSYIRHLPVQDSLKPIATFATSHSIRQIDAVDADLLHQSALYFYLRRLPGLQLRELHAATAPTAPYALIRDSSLTSLPTPCCAILTVGAYLLLEQPTP